MIKKSLDYYLSLDYSITLRKISEEDGGGWLAEIVELPGCISDGETPEEAIKNIEDAKISWIETAIARGQEILLPFETEDEYSGKFTLRIPKSLHRQLAERANREGVSLNQYILSLISYNLGWRDGENSSKHLVYDTKFYIFFLTCVLMAPYN